MLRSDDIYEELLRNHCLSNLDSENSAFEASHQASGFHLDNCDDEINIFMQRHLDVIHNITFTGECCSVVKASASIMVDELRGKTQQQAIELANRVSLLVNSQIKEVRLFDTLIKQLCAYSSRHKLKTSTRCILLPWETMIDASRKHLAASAKNDRDYSLFIE